MALSRRLTALLVVALTTGCEAPGFELCNVGNAECQRQLFATAARLSGYAAAEPPQVIVRAHQGFVAELDEEHSLTERVRRDTWLTALKMVGLARGPEDREYSGYYRPPFGFYDIPSRTIVLSDAASDQSMAFGFIHLAVNALQHTAGRFELVRATNSAPDLDAFLARRTVTLAEAIWVETLAELERDAWPLEDVEWFRALSPALRCRKAALDRVETSLSDELGLAYARGVLRNSGYATAALFADVPVSMSAVMPVVDAGVWSPEPLPDLGGEPPPPPVPLGADAVPVVEGYTLFDTDRLGTWSFGCYLDTFHESTWWRGVEDDRFSIFTERADPAMPGEIVAVWRLRFHPESSRLEALVNEAPTELDVFLDGNDLIIVGSTTSTAPPITGWGPNYTTPRPRWPEERLFVR